MAVILTPHPFLFNDRVVASQPVEVFMPEGIADLPHDKIDATAPTPERGCRAQQDVLMWTGINRLLHRSDMVSARFGVGQYPLRNGDGWMFVGIPG
jgi:hypothetical protein